MIRQLIVIENQSKLIQNDEIQKYIPDWKVQLNDHLRAFWFTIPVFDIQVGTVGSVPGSWGCYFQDGIPIKSDLGYHDDENNGVPTIRVDVQAAKQFNYQVSEIASHEFCEAAADPYEETFSEGAWGKMLAEVCDPFIMPGMTYKINETEVANFVTPAYYSLGQSARLDMKGMLKPGQQYPYMPVGAYYTIIPPGETNWKIVMAPGEELPPDHLKMVNARVAGSLRVKELVSGA